MCALTIGCWLHAYERAHGSPHRGYRGNGDYRTWMRLWTETFKQVPWHLLEQMPHRGRAVPRRPLPPGPVTMAQYLAAL